MSLRHYILGQCGQILAKIMAKILALQIGILDFGLKWPQVLPEWSIQDNLVIPHTLWLLLNRILQQQLLPSIHSSHYFKVLKVQVFWEGHKTLKLKFIYSEKATKFCEIFSLLLSYVVPVILRIYELYVPFIFMFLINDQKWDINPNFGPSPKISNLIKFRVNSKVFGEINLQK